MPTPSKPSLNSFLFHECKAPNSLRHLLLDIARACKYIHYAIRTTDAGLAGSTNQFGEQQVQLDVLSNELIEKQLRESVLVNSYISEEMQDVVELDPQAEYSVVFDPLDGSSLVEVNFAIGSIFGIYRGKDVLGRTGREMVAAAYCLYGPRTIFVCSTGSGVHEFILNEVGEFALLRSYLGIGDTAKTFSPGNIGAAIDTPAYRALIETWTNEKFGLRYSGCMVADCHHVVSKGQGIFTNIGGSKYPQGKLRLVFECGPFAYLAEQAGGAARTGADDILDVRITDIDQRCPIIFGSRNEVDRVCRALGK